VAQRLSTPLWKTIDLTFLLFAIIHGFNGFIMSIHDYIHSRSFRLLLVSIVWVLGIVIGVLGMLTIITFKVPGGGI